MKSKLTILLILVFGLAGLGFTGCSGSEESTEETQAVGFEEFQTVDADTAVVAPDTELPEDVSDQDEAPVEQQETPAVQADEQAKPIAEPISSENLMWSVQIGAFRNEEGAFSTVNQARASLNKPVYKNFDEATGLFKVTVGSFATKEQAQEFRSFCVKNGYPDAFIVQVKR